jgi:hypothetical protein
MHGMAVTCGLLVLLAGTVEAAPCVDTALVLAIDGSGSISDTEYDLQRRAFAEAFKDADVAGTLTSAGNVALSLVIWGDGEFSPDRTGWYIVENGQGVEAFVDDMLARPRRTWGNTDIGAGIWHALDMLQEICAHNRVINVSGDGKATIAAKRKVIPTLPMARRRAKEMEVTINGLAMSGQVPDLSDYYARHVLTGHRSFVVEARRREDFDVAIRKKLRRELQRQVVSMLAAP